MIQNGTLSSTLGPVRAILVGLVAVGCGGGSPDGGQVQSDGAQAAASGTEHQHASGDTHSHPGDSAHAHQSGGEHSHADGSTHTHAVMDTVAHRVDLQAEGADLGGHVTILRGGDTLRVMIELEAAAGDARHDARLLAGECGGGGTQLSSLTPVLTGSSGSGSSQSKVAVSSVSGHAHGAVAVETASGGGTACAPVHLGGSHSHGGG